MWHALQPQVSLVCFTMHCCLRYPRVQQQSQSGHRRATFQLLDTPLSSNFAGRFVMTLWLSLWISWGFHRAPILQKRLGRTTACYGATRNILKLRPN